MAKPGLFQDRFRQGSLEYNGAVGPVFRTLPSLFATLLFVASASCSGDDSETLPTPAATGTDAPISQPVTGPTATPAPPAEPELSAYPIPSGSRPHDVAPAADGGVWYTAQGSGELGWLDPDTGEVRQIPLGAGSAPHVSSWGRTVHPG